MRNLRQEKIKNIHTLIINISLDNISILHLLNKFPEEYKIYYSFRIENSHLFYQNLKIWEEFIYYNNINLPFIYDLSVKPNYNIIPFLTKFTQWKGLIINNDYYSEKLKEYGIKVICSKDAILHDFHSDARFVDTFNREEILRVIKSGKIAVVNTNLDIFNIKNQIAKLQQGIITSSFLYRFPSSTYFYIDISKYDLLQAVTSLEGFLKNRIFDITIDDNYVDKMLECSKKCNRCSWCKRYLKNLEDAADCITKIKDFWDADIRPTEITSDYPFWCDNCSEISRSKFHGHSDSGIHWHCHCHNSYCPVYDETRILK